MSAPFAEPAEPVVSSCRAANPPSMQNWCRAVPGRPWLCRVTSHVCPRGRTLRAAAAREAEGKCAYGVGETRRR